MKKYFVLILAMICASVASCSFKADSDLTMSDWMMELPDSTPMCKISIPATHDSGALYGKLVGTQTQDIDIRQQLENGIRGFDIRLSVTGLGKKLGVYHGMIYQHATWEDDVLPAFISFLKEHPTETIVVSMKCEGGDAGEYEELLEQSLQNSAISAYFVKDFSEDMTLGDCRGKILFLYRTKAGEDYPGVLCMGWADNATFELEMIAADGKKATASIEDVYSHEDDSHSIEKAELTYDHMKSAMQAPADTYKWYISYASATCLPKTFPKDFSDKINPWLADKTRGMKDACGIVFLDFAGSDDCKEVIANLIMSNK